MAMNPSEALDSTATIPVHEVFYNCANSLDCPVKYMDKQMLGDACFTGQD
jgi:hypothetical protein